MTGTAQQSPPPRREPSSWASFIGSQARVGTGNAKAIESSCLPSRSSPTSQESYTNNQRRYEKCGVPSKPQRSPQDGAAAHLPEPLPRLDAGGALSGCRAGGMGGSSHGSTGAWTGGGEGNSSCGTALSTVRTQPLHWACLCTGTHLTH